VPTYAQFTDTTFTNFWGVRAGMVEVMSNLTVKDSLYLNNPPQDRGVLFVDDSGLVTNHLSALVASGGGFRFSNALGNDLTVTNYAAGTVPLVVRPKAASTSYSFEVQDTSAVTAFAVSNDTTKVAGDLIVGGTLTGDGSGLTGIAGAGGEDMVVSNSIGTNVPLTLLPRTDTVTNVFETYVSNLLAVSVDRNGFLNTHALTEDQPSSTIFYNHDRSGSYSIVGPENIVSSQFLFFPPENSDTGTNRIVGTNEFGGIVAVTAPTNNQALMLVGGIWTGGVEPIGYDALESRINIGTWANGQSLVYSNGLLTNLAGSGALSYDVNASYGRTNQLVILWSNAVAVNQTIAANLMVTIGGYTESARYVIDGIARRGSGDMEWLSSTLVASNATADTLSVYLDTNATALLLYGNTSTGDSNVISVKGFVDTVTHPIEVSVPPDTNYVFSSAMGTSTNNLYHAFSVWRKLRKDYTGPAFTARRHRDNAFADIYWITNGGDAGTTLDTNYLQTWLEQTNIGYVAALWDQGWAWTGTNQYLTNSGLSNQPRIYDGANWYKTSDGVICFATDPAESALQGGGLWTWTAPTFIMFLAQNQQTVFGDRYKTFCGAWSGNELMVGAWTNVALSVSNLFASSGTFAQYWSQGAPIATNYIVTVVLSNAAQSTLQLNESYPASATSGNPAGYGLALGGYDGSIETRSLPMRMVEFYAWTSNQVTAATLGNLRTNIYTFYGITKHSFVQP